VQPRKTGISRAQTLHERHVYKAVAWKRLVSINPWVWTVLLLEDGEGVKERKHGKGRAQILREKAIERAMATRSLVLINY